MRRAILRLYDYLSSHKAAAAIALAVVLALCVVSALRLKYNEDISSFLPASKQTSRYTEVYDRLGANNKIAILFNGGTKEEKLETMTSFREIWEENNPDGIYPQLQDPGDSDAFFDVSDFISDNFPYFLQEQDYARMDSLLKSDGYIEQRMQANKEAMINPGPQARFLRKDPLGLFTPVWQRLQTLNPARRSMIEDGNIFTSDGSTGVIFLDSPYGSSESRKNSELVSFVNDIKAKAAAHSQTVQITSTGGPEVAVENASRIKKDSIMALLLAAILISIILWFSYKRFSDVFWILVSIAAGAVFALGLIALFKPAISIIVLGIGSTIIGIAVNYPLHYIDHLKYQPDKRKALSEQVNPLLVGNITTVGAFLSLLLLKADALHDFGFIGAMMLVGTILFVLIFLPVFIPAAGKPRNTIRFDFDRNINPSKGVRRVFFILFLAVTVVLYIAGIKVKFDADLHNINYMTADQQAGFEILSTLSGESGEQKTIYLVAEASDRDATIAAMESLSEAIPEARSLSPFVPSCKTQEERLAMWRQFWSDHADVASTLPRAATSAGFTDWAVRPFLDNISREWEIQEDSWFAPLYETVGMAMFLPCDSRLQMVAYLDVPSEKVAQREESIRAALPENCFCFNDSDLSSSLVSSLNSDFDRIGLICGIIVFLFLWLSFGSLELSIMSFLPLAVGWIWILGTMHFCGIGFNIINIILATFIFGQGDDYTIFITEGLMYEYATGKKILRSYKNAVVLSALIMFIGIGALIVARHPAMRSLASVTIIGMLTVVLMAYYLPPMVFRMLTRNPSGSMRKYPLTIAMLLCTAFVFSTFGLSLCIIALWAAVFFMFGGNNERKRLNYHRMFWRISNMAIRAIPGCRFTVRNASGEDLVSPAVYICNHQSHFDILAILSLHPKIVMLTNDWAWKMYAPVIRKADFLPTSMAFENDCARLKALVARGYSILIFPEGTRSPDCNILRFHRGAFLLAKELSVPVLPLYIHGFGYMLPKHNKILHSAGLYLEVGKRFYVPDGDIASFSRSVRHSYIAEYDRIRCERETAEYVAPYVRSRYLYKGHDAKAECRKYLRKAVYNQVDTLSGKSLEIEDAGCGVYPLLVALSHREMEVTAFFNEEEKYLTATRCAGIPSNLKCILKDED